MRDESRAFLFRLLEAAGPSNYEVEAARVWRQEAERFCASVTTDVNGNTVARLRDELRASGVDDSALDDATLEQLLGRVTRRTKFLVPVQSIQEGRALADGRSEPLLGGPAARKRRARAR